MSLRELMAKASPARSGDELAGSRPRRPRNGRGRRSCWPTFRCSAFWRSHHARARDAVYEPLDPGSLGLDHVLVRSAARDRSTFSRRPDLGWRLAQGTALERGDYDAAIVVADGLSAAAVHRHARPLVEALVQRLTKEKPSDRDGFGMETKGLRGPKPSSRYGFADWRLAPLTVCKGGWRSGRDRRAARGADDAGDAERNGVSNIRTEGLSYEAAAATLEFLMTAARERRLSGVALKDEDRYLEH